MSLYSHYFIFSTLAFIAGISFTLLLFRFPLRAYLLPITFSSFLLTQFSYLLRETLALKPFAPIFQWIVLFLLLWFLFRLHPFYSSIMAITGYIAMALLELLSIAILQAFIPDILNQLESNIWISDTAQLLVVLFVLVIGYIMNRYRLGFSFVKDSVKEVIPLRGYNLYIVIGVAVSVLLMFIHTVMVRPDNVHLLSGIIYWISIFGLLVTLSFQKEIEDFRISWLKRRGF
jgi:hypothetical protein